MLWFIFIILRSVVWPLLTRIGGVAYLLVSDSQDDEATAYIFKDVSEDDSQEACYEMVEDEDEMQAVFKVFEQMLDDVDLEM